MPKIKTKPRMTFSQAYMDLKTRDDEYEDDAYHTEFRSDIFIKNYRVGFLWQADGTDEEVHLELFRRAKEMFPLLRNLEEDVTYVEYDMSHAKQDLYKAYLMECMRDALPRALGSLSTDRLQSLCDHFEQKDIDDLELSLSFTEALANPTDDVDA